MGILTDPARYSADHGGVPFVIPTRLPLYNGSIADDATTVIRVRAEAAHKARLDNYASYEAVECGTSKFLRDSVKEVWYNDLKDADTFYKKVSALEIITFLDADSGGLHAVDVHTYYVQADGIPQYINMLEDAQKKAKRAGMPIADIKLVMMASAAVLAAQHFPCKVDDWEGLPTTSRTWPAWKKAFRLAHLKRQRQILASGGGELLGGAHGVLPEIAPTVGSLKQALDNLALAATNNSAVLQQLTAANLALTAKLVDLAMRRGGTPAAAPAASPAVGGGRSTSKPCPGNYCWTHRHRVSATHTSATCANKSPGHRDDATAANTFGGSAKDKGWDSART